MFIVLNIWIIISRKQGVSLGAAQPPQNADAVLPFGHSMFSQPSAVYRRPRREVILS